MNPKHHRTPLAIIEVLAHEAAHSLLFGLTIDEPLVLNLDDELYKSPLRHNTADGRDLPRDVRLRAHGVGHGTAHPESKSLSPAERGSAACAAKADRANFASGYEVVAEHGRLTPTGKAILANAHSWVTVSSRAPFCGPCGYSFTAPVRLAIDRKLCGSPDATFSFGLQVDRFKIKATDPLPASLSSKLRP